jgi:hypothetical protein
LQEENKGRKKKEKARRTNKEKRKRKGEKEKEREIKATLGPTTPNSFKLSVDFGHSFSLFSRLNTRLSGLNPHSIRIVSVRIRAGLILVEQQMPALRR